MSTLRQIKASAGSGKTYTLTSSFLDLLAGASDWQKKSSDCHINQEHSYSWQEILAVTFTNKAATEMREKLLSRLKDYAFAPHKDIQDDHFWNPTDARCAVDTIIRNYSALNIRTIDSLLHLMVRLSALDFGLSPDFEPRFADSEIFGAIFDNLAERARENPRLERLFKKACRQMLYSEKITGFLAGESIRNKVLALSSLMLASRNWTLDELASPETFEEHFKNIITGIQSDAQNMRYCLEKESLKASRYFLCALDSCIDCGGIATKLPLTSTMFQKTDFNECLLKVSKNMASSEVHALYASLQQDLREIRILIGARRLMPFTELAQETYSHLTEYELSTGIIAASQVPALAKCAIAGTENIADVENIANTTNDDTNTDGVNELLCRFGARITHILIDEFQDTSREQWNAIIPLVQEALARDGSLMVVGDVKQAIYGWRGGDAELFDNIFQSSSLLKACNSPQLETLHCNWRSRERIVAWNNALFAPIGQGDVARNLLSSMAEGHEDLLQRQAELLKKAFEGASQSAEHCRAGGTVCLYQIPKNKDDDFIAVRLSELIQYLGETHPWSDICILVRNKVQAGKAVAWLMALHIPVVTQGSLLLAEQPAVAALISLLRFLNDPEDDLAFREVLSCSLLPVHEYNSSFLQTQNIHDWTVSRSRKRSMAQQFALDFPDVWQNIFAPLLDQASLMTPYDTVMEIIERWQIFSRFPGEQGFIRRFLEVLYLAEDQGIADLSGFLDLWTENAGKEKAPLPETMNAVRIMTMHKSKGLEFPVVILPWMDFSSGKNSDNHAIFWDSRGIGVLAPMVKEMGIPWLEERMNTTRETLHLVYVAMTRAIEELYCFLCPPSDGIPGMLDTLIQKQRNSMRTFSCVGEDGEYTRSCWGEVQKRLPLSHSPLPESEIQEYAQNEQVNSLKKNSIPNIATDLWHPMDWLPRLRIFHSALEDWTFTAKRRGTLIHHCLEYLQISGTNQESIKAAALRAAEIGIDSFPLPVPHKNTMQYEIADILTWYASQPDTPHWLAYGTAEQSLMDADGRQSRVDLLVDDNHELVAVEYKTGTAGELPASEHKNQLLRYLNLLSQASPLPVRGVLVYLDRRELFFIAPEEYA